MFLRTGGNVLLKFYDMLNLKTITAADSEALSYIEGLYLQSFPPDERRPFDHIVAMLRREDSPFVMRLLCDDDRMVGFISCWEWPDMVYCEHFAVDPSTRGKGYGGEALRVLCGEINRPMVLEVECPGDEMSRRRIGFYQRSGFVLSTRPYVQPPYFDGATPLPMYLMFYGAPLQPGSESFDGYFDSVRDRLHRCVYGVEPGKYV